MKRLFMILAFVLLAFSVVGGQPTSNSGLTLTGSVLRVSSQLDFSDAKNHSYNIALYMQLRNDSETTLIVFRLSDFLGNKKVDFVENMASGVGEATAASEVIPGINPYRDRWVYYDPLLSFARSIDSQEPPHYSLILIEPGQYYEFRDTINVKNGYKLDIKPGQKGLPTRDDIPQAEYPAFRVEYHLSLKKHHEEADFLKTLQQRWKPFGHLVLDGSGNFTVRSELIINKPGD